MAGLISLLISLIETNVPAPAVAIIKAVVIRRDTGTKLCATMVLCIDQSSEWSATSKKIESVFEYLPGFEQELTRTSRRQLNSVRSVQLDPVSE
jgi:hypothetical protein